MPRTHILRTTRSESCNTEVVLNVSKGRCLDSKLFPVGLENVRAVEISFACDCSDRCLGDTTLVGKEFGVSSEQERSCGRDDGLCFDYLRKKNEERGREKRREGTYTCASGARGS